jgi:hypothetical protein
MNLKLKEVLFTSEKGSKSFKIKETFIRGNNVNSIQFKPDLLDKIEEEKEANISRNRLLISRNHNYDQEFRHNTAIPGEGGAGQNFERQGTRKRALLIFIII